MHNIFLPAIDSIPSSQDLFARQFRIRMGKLQRASVVKRLREPVAFAELTAEGTEG